MKRLLRLPRAVLVVFAALLAGVAVMAALQSATPPPTVSYSKDPLRAGFDAPDQTAETGADESRVVRIDDIDRMAAEKLGERPRLTPPQELARLQSQTGGGAAALAHVQRVREIRRQQGSAAAAAALKSAAPPRPMAP